MRQSSKDKIARDWKEVKTQLVSGIVGMFFLCILISFLYLFWFDEAKELMILSWKIEMYLSLSAIGLFILKRFVFDKLVGKKKCDSSR